MLTAITQFFRRLISAHFESIESQIDDELASHLQESISRLESQGTPRPQAEKIAIARFGDYNMTRHSLILEAQNSSLRARGSITALTAVVVVLAVGTTAVWGVVVAAQSHGEVLRIDRELTTLRAQLSVSGSGSAVPMAQDVNFVTLAGEFEQPLAWTFRPRDDVTLRELAMRSGGLTSRASGRIKAVRLEQGRAIDTAIIDASDWNDSAGEDLVLDGTFFVFAESTSSASADDTKAATDRRYFTQLVSHQLLPTVPARRHPR